MDGIDISSFVTLGTGALGVVIVIITGLIRKVVETAVPTIKQKAHEDAKEATYGNALSRWYNKVIVYYIPAVVGGLIGIANVPFLFGDLKTIGGRVFFGVIIGWFSRDIYKFVRALLKKQGVEIAPANES